MKDTTFAASCSQESKSGNIIMKLVNTGKESRTFKINLAGFKKIIPDAEKTVLAVEAHTDTFEYTQNVIPVKSAFKVRKDFEYSALERALTVIRIKTAK